MRPIDSASTRESRLARLVLALLPPLGALVLQLLLWPFVRPSVWFLFYPAVFLSSWIGGLRGASISAVMCALFALWFFLPPQHSFLKPVGEYFAASIFITTGVVFGVFHGRLRRANLRTQSLLAASQRANEELEKAVKERQLFAALIDNSSDFIGIADPSGKPVYVNPAGRRMVGLSADQSIEETKIAEYYTPDQRAFAEDVIVRSMIENGHWQGETAFRHWQTQEAIPVSDTHFTIRDPNTAETLGFGTVTRDISEMKQARDELERARVQTEKANAAIRAAHADLERAQSVAKLGSWRLDVRHDVLAWSDENYRIFGVPLGTPMTYEGFLACVHPDDRALIDREWKAALRGEPYDIEHRIVANGATKWVREKADLEFDEHHALVGGIGITQDVTERRKYEHELQEERERVELALRGADLGAWDWNIESGEAVFSPRWAEMRGRRPDELRGTLDTWLSGIHPEDLPRVQKILDDYLEGRTAEYEAEMRVRTQSGQWIWILDRGKVITRDPRGKPIRMVGTELDITARRRAEEELRLAEAKASGIVALSADAIITIDEAQRITLYNEGAEKIFGYSRAEAIGTPLELLIPERFRAKHRLSVQRFIAGQEAARRMIGETRALRKNGEEFPTDSSISKLEVAGRKILTVSLRDITEQKRVAREHRLLAEVGALFASTLEYEETVSTIARLAARDLSDFCIVDVAVAGDVPRQIVESRDPEDAWICGLLHALMLDRSRQFLTRGAFETRKPVLLEHLSPDMVSSFAQSEEHLRALQALDPKSVILVPLLVHGEMLGALALVSSTESRVYGPSDVRLAEELALRAALAIANARLYRVAQRAIKAREDILGIVAHDLRNPLGTVLMQAGLLRRPGGGPDRRSRNPAEVIGRAAKRMNRLIQDLLDVTRMEAGHLSVQQRPVPAAEIVFESLDAQKALAASASIEFCSDVAQALPDVSGDRDRLLQVFENLIGNALKFTKPGGRITVGAAPRTGEVLYWVADTGAGISADDLPHVFDEFWQAEHAKRSGAGLGLPIVRGIVEAHGGRVWVESSLGRGTIFFFTIPTASHVEQGRPEPTQRAR